MRRLDRVLAIGAGSTALGMGLLAAVLPLYARSLGASAALVGAILAGFGLARLMTALPATWLAERIGYRRLLIASPALTAPIAALCAVPASLSLLALMCLTEGAAAATFATMSTTMLLGHASRARRGRILATYQGATLLGAAIGPVLGGIVARRWGLQVPFLLYALIAALTAIWLQVRLAPARTWPIAPAERSAQPLQIVWHLLVDPRLATLWLVSFSLVFTRVGAQLIGLPLLGAVRLGLNAQQIGVALTLSGLASVSTLYPGGWISDRFGRKRTLLLAGVTMAGALVLLAESRTFAAFLGGALVLGAGTGLSGSTPITCLSELVRTDDRATGVGLYRTFSDLGATLAPPAIGWVIEHGGNRAAFAGSALLVLGAVGAFVWHAPARPSPNHLNPP